MALTSLTLVVSCGGTDASTSTEPSPSSASSGPSSTPTPTGSAPASPSPSATPALPSGVPPSYDDDVPSADVPPAALIPPGTDLTGTWYGSTSAGEAIVVAWVVPGRDPFLLAHGLAVWRRFDDDGAPWRPVAGRTWGKRSGVFGVDVLTGDVTADGSDDALVQAQTGGSGACAVYSVFDLAAGAEIFERDVCDTTIEPASPPGLVVREAVFGANDPHCCPSAFRVTVLTYGEDGWIVASESTSPTA